MGARALLLAIVLAPGCAARQAIPIAAGADLATTEVVICRGGYERNPLPHVQTTAGRALSKVAATVFLVWLCGRLEKDGHERVADVLKWGTVGAWGGAAVWNVHEARGQ